MKLSDISIFAFHLLLRQTTLVSSSQCTKKVFQECRSYRATTKVVYSTKTADFHGCQRACLLDPSCNGFNIIWQKHNSECQLLRFAFPLTFFTVDAKASLFYNCPIDMRVWTYGEHIACYKIEDDPSMQWDDAMEYCRRYHPLSHLIDIETEDEKKAAIINIPASADWFWTAGVVMESGNIWVTTEKTVNSSLVEWFEGEPGSYQNNTERAIAVQFNRSTVWAATPVTEIRKVICEL